MNKPNPQPAYLIMMLILVADQVTKLLVRLNLELHESIPVLSKVFGDTFMLTHVNNTGAAFSIGFGNPATNRIIFIIITLVALVFILYLLYQSVHRIQVVAFGLVMGGAVGNLIDRIIYGGVTDFVNVDFPDFIMQRFPIFNVADSSIFIAVSLLIIDMLFIKDAPAPVLESQPQDDNEMMTNTEEI